MNVLLDRFVDIKYNLDGKWLTEKYDSELKFTYFIHII